MTYVYTPPDIPAVPVTELAAEFAVHRIYCVGQNYAAHVIEMGGDPKAGPPIFFSKPADAIVINGAPVNYPQGTSELHHEVELVVALGSGGRNIKPEEALTCVFGYAVGIDFTRRDLQAAAKKGGKPWDVAKGFDQSAPISAIKPVGDQQHPLEGMIELRVNGEIRQQSNLNDMIWSVAEIIAELSRYFELKTGDLIYTGTPSGVAAVVPGDRLEARIDGVGELAFDLVAAAE